MAVTLVAFASACSTTRFKEKADKEVYSVIAEKASQVPGMIENFSIEESGALTLDGFPVQEAVEESLGETGQAEVGSAILSLEDALAIAVQHSREYQSRKEAVYLQALSLTLDRHQFTSIFSGSVSGDVQHATRDIQKSNALALAAQSVPGQLRQVSALTGTAGQVIAAYADVVEQAATLSGVNQPNNEILNERDVTGRTNFGVDRLMKGGGRLAADLTSNFLRFITGDPRVATSSALLASFTQPILRGAGKAIAAEALTQAERDVLYELRAFTRYRKEFSVDIASQYYSVLEARDSVRNNWRSYQNFQRSLERERALAGEGRRAVVDVSRIEQALLQSEIRWVNSVQSYRQSLDRFKIRLGISTDAHVLLDDAELVRLLESGIEHPEIAPEEAIEVAFVARLDFYTEQDIVEDAQRRLNVATNGLLPDLDLSLQASVDSVDGDRFQELDWRRARLDAGLDFDIPFDRKAERNNYRAALINLDRVVREYELAEDTIKLNIRDDWRDLEQARQNYETSLNAVALAERRVEEQELRAELGLATALDQVDAQNALTDAQNALTSALVSHTIARLAFWRDMGILYIKDNGQWEEISDVEQLG